MNGDTDMADIYRGYEISREPNGKFVWADDRGFIHSGRIDTRGGFDTEEQAMSDIDAFKKRPVQGERS